MFFLGIEIWVDQSFLSVLSRRHSTVLYPAYFWRRNLLQSFCLPSLCNGSPFYWLPSRSSLYTWLVEVWLWCLTMCVLEKSRHLSCCDYQASWACAFCPLILENFLGSSVLPSAPPPCTLPFSFCFNGGESQLEKKVKVKAAQSCPTLWDPMDCTVRGILQARILEWVAFPSAGDLRNPGTEPTLQADSLPAGPQGKPFPSSIFHSWALLDLLLSLS